MAGAGRVDGRPRARHRSSAGRFPSGCRCGLRRFHGGIAGVDQGGERRALLQHRGEGYAFNAERGQPDAHLRSNARLARNLDGAAMQLGELLGQRQAKPSAFEALGQAVVDLAEFLEGGVDLGASHADAGVPDGDAKPAAVLQGGADFDFAARRRELDGVRQHVDEHLPQPDLVAADLDALLRIFLQDPHITGFGLRLDRAQAGIEDRAQIGLALGKLDLAGLDLGDVENVVDDGQEMVARIVDVAGIFEIGGRSSGRTACRG